jgi:hypothetical protein
VRVYANGREVARKDDIASSDELIELHPGEHLAPREKVVAEQTLNGDGSGIPPAEGAVEVLSEPDRSDLDRLDAPFPLLQCATCIFVGGTIPGGNVSLYLNNDPPISVATDDIFTHIELSSGNKLFPSDRVEVSQTACGIPGHRVPLPSPLPLSLESWPGKPPRITPDPVRCQQTLTLEDLVPGATTVITLDDAEYSSCFASSRGFFRLPRQLNPGDTLGVRQEFHWCQLKSDTVWVATRDGVPEAPWLPSPVCEGDRRIEVAGLVKDALIEVEADGNRTLCRAAAPEELPSRPFLLNIPPLTGVSSLRIRQSLCRGEEGSWSAWSERRRVTPLNPTIEPRLQQPLFDGGMAVGVAVDQRFEDGVPVGDMSVRKGTFVEVISMKRGSIGQAWANGNERLDIHLFFPLEFRDQIHLRTIRCGHQHDWDENVPVMQRPDLAPPVLDDPVRYCAGSVRVSSVANGAFVDVFRQRADGGLTWLGREWAGAGQISVDVGDLAAGEHLCAQQRLQSSMSAVGPVAVVPEVPKWNYVPNSAFRLCQLTQDWDPTGRPHGAPTTPLGLGGTDLGISVEHKGLYFFFGDCTAMPHNAQHGDPIAWATTTDPDDLEDEALNLHWILGDGGYFRRLIVDGLPSLGYFEVPTGAFSYDGKLCVFIGREPEENPVLRMTASFLAVGDDPHQNFKLAQGISKTIGTPDPARFPGNRWMLHIAPVVVRNADWPGLPVTPAEHGVLLFGSSIYRGLPASDLTWYEKIQGNVYLAWAPLAVGLPPGAAPIPTADTWLFWRGRWASGKPRWETLGAMNTLNVFPEPILPADPDPSSFSGLPRLLGEISAAWYPALRLWVLAGSAPAPINVARHPWGPWSTSQTICDPALHDRDAGNHLPGGEWNKTKVSYAPYLVPRWWRWDRSVRKVTLYYVLSVYDEPNNQLRYQPQLMRSQISC